MVYILLGTGFEEVEAIAPGDILRRAQIPMQYVGLEDRVVAGAHGIAIEADITLDQLDLTQLDMIVLPGGMGGVESVLACPAALDAIRFAAENDRFVAAICAAPTILAGMGLLEGKKATCYPGMEGQMAGAVMVPGAQAVVDGKFITGRAPGAAMEFGLTLAEQLADQAQFDAATVAQYMVYDR
jgi:4-methyl-5(b-hydroxyethyl)-thiazole monophosphate biosynthesis